MKRISVLEVEKRNATKLLSKFIINRDKKCLWCGSVKTLGASHIYPKGKYPRMEFNTDNLVCLCWRCHLCRWHKSPIEAYEWIITAIPRQRLKKLKELSLSQLPKTDYNQIIKELS